MMRAHILFEESTKEIFVPNDPALVADRAGLPSRMRGAGRKASGLPGGMGPPGPRDGAEGEGE